jgi:hypothetical protein
MILYIDDIVMFDMDYMILENEEMVEDEEIYEKYDVGDGIIYEGYIDILGT